MDNYLESLKKDLKDKKQMVLFLGAGVNFSENKKMLWKDILSQFLDRAIPLLDMTEEETNYIKRAFYQDSEYSSLQLKGTIEFSTEMKVSIVKSLLGNAYIPILQEILYSQCNHEELEKACNNYINNCTSTSTPFYTLFSIAEMIIRNENIKAVVTYNYDNFLSDAIQLLQAKGSELFKDKNTVRIDAKEFCPIDMYSGWDDKPFVNSSFPIYHIHGYIQPPDVLKPNPRNKVVMSLDEFYEHAEDTNAWHKAVQLNYLTHYTCLYLGASLSDMTMQRVLNAAKIQFNNENVYYLTEKEKNDAYGALKKLKNKLFMENHLKVIEVEDYETFYNDINHKK